MAAHAASLMAGGAEKSGKPCERVTPPYMSFRRVISRMTDSVNCVAFREPLSFDMARVYPGKSERDRLTATESLRNSYQGKTTIVATLVITKVDVPSDDASTSTSAEKN